MKWCTLQIWGVVRLSRELSKLTDAGLLVMHKIKAIKTITKPITHHRSCMSWLLSLKKIFGVAAVLKTALAPILPQLEQAFVYGSIAKGNEHAGSDVDVMLVGDNLSYSEIMQLLSTAQSQLQRTVNPTVEVGFFLYYTPKELSDRLLQGQEIGPLAAMLTKSGVMWSLMQQCIFQLVSASGLNYLGSRGSHFVGKANDPTCGSAPPQ